MCEFLSYYLFSIGFCGFAYLIVLRCSNYAFRTPPGFAFSFHFIPFRAPQFTIASNHISVDLLRRLILCQKCSLPFSAPLPCSKGAAPCAKLIRYATIPYILAFIRTRTSPLCVHAHTHTHHIALPNRIEFAAEMSRANSSTRCAAAGSNNKSNGNGSDNFHTQLAIISCIYLSCHTASRQPPLRPASALCTIN